MRYHATNEIMALKKQATDLAIALGWNEEGVREQKFIDQFNVLKMKVPIQYGTGVNITFCRKRLDLSRLVVSFIPRRVQQHHERKALEICRARFARRSQWTNVRIFCFAREI